jgi:hypothetical protein
VCGVCGAPRVDIPGEKLPEETAVALREADQARKKAAVQRVATWGLGVPSAFILMLAVMLAPASYLTAGLLIGLGLVLAVMSARASRKGGTERKRMRGAVERAWEAAILHLASKNKTVSEIGAALRIAEADVETALAVRGQLPQVRIAAPEAPHLEDEEQAEAEATPGTEKRT